MAPFFFRRGMWLGSFSAETLLERQTPEGPKPSDEIRGRVWYDGDIIIELVI